MTPLKKLAKGDNSTCIFKNTKQKESTQVNPSFFYKTSWKKELTQKMYQDYVHSTQTSNLLKLSQNSTPFRKNKLS